MSYISGEYENIHRANTIEDILMFDEALNSQLEVSLLKNYYIKLMVMCEVKHTFSLFFNDVSKITLVNQIIKDQKK